ncbi:MAG: site-specific integrase [Phycisphaeraceae bacterium]|nr:MAG: site-specific integrase [Phycisphaeraceae bacterium]
MHIPKEGESMSSIIRDPEGRKRITFGPVDARRTIRLGKCGIGDAEKFRVRVDALISARALNQSPDASTAEWLRGLPAAMHERLVRVGLADPRVAPESTSLGSLLDRFVNAGVIKASTRAAYRQATESLRKHLGADTPVDALTPSDADRWRKAIADEGLAPATVAKRVNIAKAIFRKAVRWEIIDASPFEDLRSGSQCNPDRAYYVSTECIRAVLDACPDHHWRAIIALARFAGLRCPSEHLGLKWSDVNWERARLTVRSPKTAAHEGHAQRVVPIAPELFGILTALFDGAEPGTDAMLPRLREPGVNLRTTFQKIIVRAGEPVWPRLFHNLRASCATDWVERFPAHAVAKWLGHSPMIAAQHYLQTRDAHFDLAAGLTPSGAESGAPAAQNEAQHPPAPNRKDSKERLEVSVESGFMRDPAINRESTRNKKVGATGLEPVTSAM